MFQKVRILNYPVRTLLLASIVLFGLFWAGSASATSCNCDVNISSTDIINLEKYHPSTLFCKYTGGFNMLTSLGTKITRRNVFDGFINSLNEANIGVSTACYYWDFRLSMPPYPDFTSVRGMGEEVIINTKEDCESFEPNLSIDNSDLGKIVFSLSCKGEAFPDTKVTPTESKEDCGPLGCTAGAAFKDLNKLKLSGEDAIPNLIGRIIKAGMQVIGSIALIIFVAGGLMWMTARGNSERISSALKMITWASLGIIVILSSYMLVEFVFGVFK